MSTIEHNPVDDRIADSKMSAPEIIGKLAFKTTAYNKG